MAKETPLINILTYRLPFELANQIYNEYQSRLKEVNFLVERYKTYKPLAENIKTVELFLSLSIFHRRIITNLDGAVKFYGTVTKKGNTNTIRIGSYDLTGAEKNKLLAVVLNYNELLAKFSIPPTVMEYFETREFLKKLKTLKSSLEDANKSEKGNNKKIEDNSKRNENSEEDLPF